jgi:hypothetical protein
MLVTARKFSNSRGVIKIMANKPHDSNPFSDVVRCGAKTRRGTACQCPAMKNGRCRLHGGLSTGPKTEEGRARCGNWKHGLYSKGAKEERTLIKKAVDDTVELIEALAS